MVKEGTTVNDTHPGRPTKYVATLFTVEEFYTFWPKLERTLDTIPHTWRHWTKEHIYTSIEQGKVQVWGIGVESRATLVLFTSVNAYPAVKVFTILWAAGHLEDDMLPMLDGIFESYGLLNGCEEIEIRGRNGWEAKLKPLGYKCEARMWTRSIRGGRLN